MGQILLGQQNHTTKGSGRPETNNISTQSQTPTGQTYGCQEVGGYQRPTKGL